MNYACTCHYKNFNTVEALKAHYAEQPTMKDCPFCGHTATAKESFDTTWQVSCNWCTASVAGMNSKDEAIGAWDKRND